jgi:hypothetical protein
MRLPFRKKDKESKDFKPPKSAGLSPPEYGLCPRPDGIILQSTPTYRSSELLSQLPGNVLERIFQLVAPHTMDETYETCENSANESGCSLCDLRDLANCTKVCKRWRPSAHKVLYHSVRIDAVHFCALEAVLAEKRKKVSRFDKNGIPENVAQTRLQLFRRTVREDPAGIGKLVTFLKVPYMLRESSHSELAQTLAVLPNLQYVDLPEGVFSDDPSFTTLRLEAQSRCPNIRKMTYLEGSENSFKSLAYGRVWPRLEVLEITGLQLEPIVVRHVLSSLLHLRALKITDTHSLSDEVLSASADLPPLPALEEIVFKNTPRLTVSGLTDYLSWQETQDSLKVLTLKETGVPVSAIEDVLEMAASLQTLAIQAKVTEPFQNPGAARPLTSQSLETLSYEITSVESTGPYAGLADGHYAYLAHSIHADGLPKLRRLFVYDGHFPEMLQKMPAHNNTVSFKEGRMWSPASPNPNRSPRMNKSSPRMTPVTPGIATFSPPSPPKFTPNSPPLLRPISKVPPTNRFSSTNPWHPPSLPSPTEPHMLEIFCKSEDHQSWNFARVDPFKAQRQIQSSSRKRMSSYGLGPDVAGQDWDAAGTRRSVLIGSGAGGYLNVSDFGGPPDKGNNSAFPNPRHTRLEGREMWS